MGRNRRNDVQGERVQKLDQIANDTMTEVLRRSGCVAAMPSEEENDFVIVEGDSAGDYIVVFDPDGSSNIDVGVSIGTIFGVYRKESNEQISLESILRAGREQVVAGYIVYGSSTARIQRWTHSRLLHSGPIIRRVLSTRQDVRCSRSTQLLSLNECNEFPLNLWVSRLLAQVKG